MQNVDNTFRCFKAIFENKIWPTRLAFKAILKCKIWTVWSMFPGLQEMQNMDWHCVDLSKSLFPQDSNRLTDVPESTFQLWRQWLGLEITLHDSWTLCMNNAQSTSPPTNPGRSSCIHCHVWKGMIMQDINTRLSSLR